MENKKIAKSNYGVEIRKAMRRVGNVGVEPSNIKGSENNVLIRGKRLLPRTQSLQQRSALGEVGNRLQTLQSQRVPIKKVESLDVVKKINSATTISTTTTTSTTTRLQLAQKQLKKAVEKKVIPFKDSPQEEEEEEQIVPAFSTKELSRVLEVDTSDDPQLVSEYAQDIYKYLVSLEAEYSIPHNFLKDHCSSQKMRGVLINWMIEVHMNFKLLLETLHLSIALVDRYLQINRTIGRENLQLVGTTALYLAAKYEEIYIPDLGDFVYICDEAFSKREILAMERDILKQLDFNLGRPQSLHFLRRFNKIAEVVPVHHTLGKYILELALLDYEHCVVAPSIQAAAACCLALSVIDNVEPSQAWTRTLEHYSSYKYSDIKSTVVGFASMLNNAEFSRNRASYTKYSTLKYDKISLHPKLKSNMMRKLIAQSSLVRKK